MRHIKNYFYKFMAGFYQELRDFSDNISSDPIKVIEYDMKMQRWENKVK